MNLEIVVLLQLFAGMVAEGKRRVQGEGQAKYLSPYQLVLENGRHFPLIERSDISKGMPNDCFYNCFQAVWLYDELIYCEGYICSPLVPIPIDHAWLSNSKGEAIDVTLPYDSSRLYFGVGLSYRFVKQRTLRQGVYGLLPNDYLNRSGDSLQQVGFPPDVLIKFDD